MPETSYVTDPEPDDYAADLIALAERCTDAQLGKVLRSALGLAGAVKRSYGLTTERDGVSCAYMVGGLEALVALGECEPVARNSKVDAFKAGAQWMKRRGAASYGISLLGLPSDDETLSAAQGYVEARR